MTYRVEMAGSLEDNGEGGETPTAGAPRARSSRRPYKTGSLTRLPQLKADGTVKTRKSHGSTYVIYSDTWEWRLRIVDPKTGEQKRLRRRFTATSEKKAVEVVDGLLDDAMRRPRRGDGPSLDDVFDRWMDQLAVNEASVRHITESRRRYRTIWQPELGHRAVGTIDLRALNDAIEDRRFEVSGSTVRTWVSTIRGILELAVDEGYIEANPATRMKLQKSTGLKVEPMPAETGRLVIERIRERDVVAAEVCWLLRLTGMRRGEACALRWSDLSLKSEVPFLTVKNTAWQRGKEWGLKPPKSKKGARVVPLPASAADRLEGWRKFCEQRARETHYRYIRNAFVFALLPSGEVPIMPDRVTRAVGKASKELYEEGLIDATVHTHMWRHEVVSNLVASGIDLAAIADVVGHATPDLTLRQYTKAKVDQARTASALESFVIAAEEESEERDAPGMIAEPSTSLFAPKPSRASSASPVIADT